MLGAASAAAHPAVVLYLAPVAASAAAAAAAASDVGPPGRRLPAFRRLPAVHRCPAARCLAASPRHDGVGSDGTVVAAIASIRWSSVGGAFIGPTSGGKAAATVVAGGGIGRMTEATEEIGGTGRETTATNRGSHVSHVAQGPSLRDARLSGSAGQRRSRRMRLLSNSLRTVALLQRSVAANGTDADISRMCNSRIPRLSTRPCKKQE